MKPHTRILAALLALALCSCDEIDFNINSIFKVPDEEQSGDGGSGDVWNDADIDTEGLVQSRFSEYKSVIANPERGFYKHVEFWSPSSSVSKSELEAARNEGITLALFICYLRDYMNGDIADNYINNLSAALSTARKAGIKVILRFAYKNSDSNSSKPWDPAQTVVKRHIQQLKPLFQDNSDVILCLQAGFVGVWGEWYYTSNFGMDPVSDADYEPRRQVMEALLDAMPASRQVAVRTPAFKLNLLRIRKSDTLTRATAYKDTPVARICAHNDCFLAASDDWGTFMDNTERKYWESDSKYTLMGGETCALAEDDPSISECPNAISQMEKQHWTYLNSGYNQNVIGGFESGGCLKQMKLRLGYRLVLTESYISPDIKAGSKVRTVFKLRNDGFAAPINPRGLEVILVKSTGEKTVIPVRNVSPRYWLAGKKPQFEVDFTAPEAGRYTLYLNLPDPENSLHDNPNYSIRLANNNTWEASTGYNKITEFEVE